MQVSRSLSVSPCPTSPKSGGTEPAPPNLLGGSLTYGLAASTARIATWLITHFLSEIFEQPR
jgi:hypothetical protein